MNHFKLLLASIAFCWLAVSPLTAAEAKSRAGEMKFTNVEEQTREFVGYFNSIKLTPEQERVKEKALSQMPAPCCSKFPMATCCCPCNLAKAVWGLSNYLIVRQQLQVDQVAETVKRWIDFIHPKGFSGNTCDENRCNAPFRQDGCGGMNENDLIF